MCGVYVQCGAPCDTIQAANSELPQVRGAAPPFRPLFVRFYQIQRLALQWILIFTQRHYLLMDITPMQMCECDGRARGAPWGAGAGRTHSAGLG